MGVEPTISGFCPTHFPDISTKLVGRLYPACQRWTLFRGVCPYPVQFYLMPRR